MSNEVSSWLFQMQAVAEIIATAAQILLIIVAIWAGFAAYRQIGTFKLFELLKHLEEPSVREARWIVFNEIAHLKPDEEWWADERLSKAAALVSATYDHLGAVIRFDRMDPVGRLYVERWGGSLVRTHQVLDPFLRHRRNSDPTAYIDFTWLYERSMRKHKKVRPPTKF